MYKFATVQKCALRLQIFATTTINLKEIEYFSHAASYNIDVFKHLAHRVNRLVLTIRINLFVKKKRKLHRFTTTNSNFEKKIE